MVLIVLIMPSYSEEKPALAYGYSDLKLRGVRCSVFSYEGVWWNEIICGAGFFYLSFLRPKNYNVNLLVHANSHL